MLSRFTMRAARGFAALAVAALLFPELLMAQEVIPRKLPPIHKERQVDPPAPGLPRLTREKTLQLKQKIKSALIYPVAVLVVAFVVLSVIMIFVIPAFKDVFTSFGADLPAPTLAVIAMSEFFVAYWYIIFGVLIGGELFVRSHRSDWEPVDDEVTYAAAGLGLRIGPALRLNDALYLALPIVLEGGQGQSSLDEDFGDSDPGAYRSVGVFLGIYGTVAGHLRLGLELGGQGWEGEETYTLLGQETTVTSSGGGAAGNLVVGVAF